jgi:hypothetical protein
MSKRINPREARAIKIAHKKQRAIVDEWLAAINDTVDDLFDRETVHEIKRLTADIGAVMDGKSFRT